MPHTWFFLAGLLIGQAGPVPTPPLTEPGAAPAVPSQPGLGTSATPSATEPGAAVPPAVPNAMGQPPQVPAEPDSEIDEYLRTVADEIDALEYVQSDIRQAIRLADRVVTSTGSYAKGPDYRVRFELDVDLYGGSGKRVHACDGETGVIYEQLLEQQQAQTFQIQKLIPLLEQLPDDAKPDQGFLARVLFLNPGNMLRGHLDTFTFTKREEGTLGEESPRPVEVFEGRWRTNMLPRVAGNPNVTKIDQLQGSAIPQYLRLYLDAETKWPLRIELFRRTTEVELKPLYALEFVEVGFPKQLADDVFVFEPPVPEEQVVDITDQIVATLKQIIPAAGASAPLDGGASGVLPGAEPEKPASSEAKSSDDAKGDASN